MAETEIQILISLQDEMTAGFERIQKTLEQGNQNIVKATEQTTMSFQKQISTLMAVGNMASSVDAIWSSYVNLQLRLENASERLINAQERLEDTQRKLNRMYRDGKSTADDLADAQRDVERASRGLTISQNNLERVQNRVVGTYITMAVQGLSVVNALVNITKALQGTIIATTILNALTNPLIATLGIVAAVAGVTAVVALMDNRDATENAYKTTSLYSESQQNLYASVSATNPVLQAQTDILARNVVLTGDNLTVAQKFAYIQMYNAQNYIMNEEEKQRVAEETAKKEDENLRDLYMRSVSTFNFIEKEYQEWKQRQIALDKGWSNSVQAEYDKIIAKIDEAIAKQAQISAVYPEYFKGEAGRKVKVIQGEGGAIFLETLKPSQQDFISRPGQEPISFSPNDTIIGVDDINSLTGGGINITITGNVYGTDPDEIAEALIEKLRRKISL